MRVAIRDSKRRLRRPQYLTVRISQSELPENDTEIHYIVVTYVTTLMVDRDAARCSDALAKMQYCNIARVHKQYMYCNRGDTLARVHNAVTFGVHASGRVKEKCAGS